MTYLILAEICLTVGAPNWVVAVSFVCFGLRLIQAAIKTVRKVREKS